MMNKEKISLWYDKNYKILLALPVILFAICFVYLIMFYAKTGDFIIKDTSLAGGTTITLNMNLDVKDVENKLKEEITDIQVREIKDVGSDRAIAIVIESSSDPDPLKALIEEKLEIKLNDENSSTEFTGPALSQGFYNQLIIAIIISFILMSFVIFFMFRTFVPSIAVIFAALADIVMPLALLNFLGVKISAAGIAAFLMLIGYSVDTDILLTTRAIKNKGSGTLNERIFGSFKTGIFMTTTALLAVIPSFIFGSSLPDSFRQIFLILALGLFADIINTWLTNASIIKWYGESRGIK